jgi:hypothetical protein
MKWYVLVFVMLMILGCGSQESPRGCEPNTTQECYCLGGKTGIQTCNTNRGWGVCQCETDPTDKYPSGYVLFGCGCWGPGTCGSIFSNSKCQSGQQINLCCDGYFCSGGGLQWGAKCY